MNTIKINKGTATLIYLAIALLIATCASAQVKSDAVATIHTYNVEGADQLAFNFDYDVDVEVRETAGSRLVIETYVSSTGSKRTNEQVADIVAPIFVRENDTITLKNIGQVLVNKSNAEVKHIVFIPASIRLAQEK